MGKFFKTMRQKGVGETARIGQEKRRELTAKYAKYAKEEEEADRFS